MFGSNLVLKFSKSIPKKGKENNNEREKYRLLCTRNASLLEFRISKRLVEKRCDLYFCLIYLNFFSSSDQRR